MILDLFKIRITALVSITTAFGYLLQKGVIDSGIILPVLGIFILACASAAINHLQEKDIDILMKRTKSRPLPSGTMSVNEVIFTVIALIIAGSLVLIINGNITVLLLGYTALIWYNVIYTPLKRKSAFAVIPGSVIGSIPPVAGWVAAGGNILDSGSLLLAFFFFIWQIPHFWLLILFLNRDYMNSGLPTVLEKFSKNQLSRITFTWIVATAFSGIMFPVFGMIHNAITSYIILGAALILIIYSFALLKNEIDTPVFRKTFISVNFYILLLVLIISFDKLYT
ncbi:MAG: protoheme IX farnesyltransferase [Ignavibacteriaceae bacterium]|nr:protoheme IX farnesyltransferase [Ignavibacteriaceae bacterium]